MPPRVSIKRTFTLITAGLGVLVLALVGLIVNVWLTQTDLIEHARAHFDAFRLADELVDHSNRRTMMARLYADTGDARFREHYRDIVAIHHGEAPRPPDYSLTYWDRVLGNNALPRGERALSFDARLRALELDPDARTWLEEAQRRSLALMAREEEALAAVAGLAPDGGGAFTLRRAPDPEAARRLLTGPSYLQQKADVMEAASQAYAAIERVRERVERERAQVKTDIYRVLAAALLTALAAAAAFLYTTRHVIRPMGVLGRQVGRIAAGDYTARNAVREDNELGMLGETLNRMSEAVAGDLEARRVETERFALATRVAQLGIWDWDVVNDDLRWDATMYRIYGVSPERFGGAYEAWQAGLHPDDRDPLHGEVQRALRGEKEYDAEFRVVLPDGAIRNVHANGIVLRDGTGAPVRMLGTNMDVTGQKRLERELHDARDAAESANRAKSAFLATMSHEIRTPLNGLLGLAELLGMGPLTPDQRTTLAVIRDSGISLQRIIDDILDFSKIEAGKLDLQPEAISVADLIERVRDMYSGNASRKGLAFRQFTDPRLSPALRADPLRLRQVLSNFVSNALKFTVRGHVEIRAVLEERRDGHDRVRFSVTDSGIGIAAEDLKRLFQPFAQVRGVTQVGGTGLGLAICQRLATLMGGTVSATSEPGRGSTFSMTLDLRIADPDDVAPARGPSPGVTAAALQRRAPPSIGQAEAERTLVLLADDHPTNRMVLLRQLNTLGYAAETASNGAEAFRLWKSGRFALVVADCHMPEMDGYQLARSIREMEAGCGLGRTPIVACTANALRDEAANCFTAGMDDYLAKPVELAQLMKKLDQWLPLPAGGAPGAPETAGGNGPLDRSVLAEASNGDAGAEREFLTRFRTACARDSVRLAEAVERDDVAEVVRTSHRMKGASLMVGANGLARVCAEIEKAGRERDRGKVAVALAGLRPELEQLNAYFDAL